jgi:hypothetical protein
MFFMVKTIIVTIQLLKIIQLGIGVATVDDHAA